MRVAVPAGPHQRGSSEGGASPLLSSPLLSSPLHTPHARTRTHIPIQYSSLSQTTHTFSIRHTGNPQTAWHVAKANIMLNADCLPAWHRHADTNRRFEYFYREVTDADMAAGERFPLEAVVLPVLGSSTPVSAAMRDRLVRDGMLDALTSTAQREYPGAYRHLISCPLNLRYRLRTDDDDRWTDWTELHHPRTHVMHFSNFPFSAEVEELCIDGRLDKLLYAISNSSEVTGLSAVLAQDEIFDVKVPTMASRRIGQIGQEEKQDARINNDESSLSDQNKRRCCCVQVGFSLCSSTYATTYIEQLIKRV